MVAEETETALKWTKGFSENLNTVSGTIVWSKTQRSQRLQCAEHGVRTEKLVTGIKVASMGMNVRG